MLQTLAIILLASIASIGAGTLYDCYLPVPGGWEIRLTANTNAPRGDPAKTIGVVSANAANNPRLHRRPLFPACERAMLFSPEELTKLERVSFRPIVLAYNEPRFLFDFHSAGGLLGHLMLGLMAPDGSSKWLHQWTEITATYIEGRMEYELQDGMFPGARIRLTAIALADAAGLLVELDIKGAPRGSALVWMYGGASAFFTNWAMNAPEFDFTAAQCAKDKLRWTDNKFVLTRAFDQKDVFMNEVFAVTKRLPNWKATIEGGCSWEGISGFGAPDAVRASPAALLRTARWSPIETGSNCVAVFRADLPGHRTKGFVVVGTGRDIAADIRHPEAARKAALTRNRQIAARIVTHTPDPYLDAAMTMMAFATEGTWADQAYVHGGWSWRFAYLGWRILYGPTCYGWMERVEKTLRNHSRLNLVKSGPDQGALGSLLEYDPGVYYNMNEVFLDHVRQFFDYSGDLSFLRDIYPICQGILEWEERRLKPGDEPLYENALNTWISDQHWYIRGQCTQASAYMLGANTFMAEAARRLGKEPTPFQQRADSIRRAMQNKLWMPSQGVFAEYLDTLGARLLHAQPELPTLYHSAEFGAALHSQILQMIRWAHANLARVRTPNDGELYWSSNWYPNMGRSYTHSTYEMAYAEELNFALTHYLAGLPDDAYSIIRACLCGIFNGPTPGGLACHAYIDGRQRANDEFADASSMWGRTIAEGMFGIRPRRADQLVLLSPQLPSSWPIASIRTPHFQYEWRRSAARLQIDWSSPVSTAVRVRLPLLSPALESVNIDGKKADFSLETVTGVPLSWLSFQTPKEQKGTIIIRFKGGSKRPDSGSSFTLQSIDRRTSALTGAPTVFSTTNLWSAPKVPRHDLTYWIPLDLRASFNASVGEAMERVHAGVQPPPPPASPINTAYYKDHLVAPFVSPKPADDAWRKKVGPDGLAWTTDGIPFLSSKEGPNIALVTRAAVFPQKLTFPVNHSGRKLYLMISGTTFAMQSHVTNLRVTLGYADGSSEPFDLVNPITIGDCWNQYRYHDTAANGFENIGGRSGPAGSADVRDLTRPIPVDTEAHLLAFALKPGTQLHDLQLEAVANDVIFGLMGATLLK